MLNVERGNLSFNPGQHVSLGIPSTSINREYSIYSGNDDDFLAFLIRKVGGGTLTPQLEQLKPGELVELNGPFGGFILQSKFRRSPHWFIATGTGIAPFHSFVRSYPDLDYRILHGVRFPNETYEKAGYDASRYFPCFSTQGKRVTDHMRAAALDPESLFYLCGNRSMINDVYDILRGRNVSSDRIFTEAFF